MTRGATAGDPAPWQTPPGQIDLDGATARLWQARGGRTARFLGLALAALLLGGLAIGQLGDRLGWFPPSSPGSKLQLLRDNPDSTLLFVGTSQMFYGLDPAAVDAALAEAGCRERSLNLASPAATLPEMAMMVDAIADTLPPGRLVVVAGSGFAGPAAGRPLPHERREATRLGYLSFEIAATRTLRAPWTHWLRFAEAALEEELGLHRLYTLVFQPGGKLPGDGQVALRQRGFVAMDSVQSPRFAKLRARFLERLAALADPAAVAALRDALRELDPALAASALAIARHVEESGNRVALLAMPSAELLGALALRNALALRPDLAAVDLALDRDLVPYPDPAFFFDEGHLTGQGAAVVSRAVGLRLCQLIRAGL